MMLDLFGTPTKALITSLAGGSALIAATAALMPSTSDLTAAIGRASWTSSKPAAPAPAVAAVPGRTPAMLATMFAQGASLSLPELKWLLASSTATADAATLTAIARRIDASDPVATRQVTTRQVTWDILAGKRPAVARAFLEQRPDRASPENWQLRFDLSRQTGDEAFARSMVQAAATSPGGPPPAQLIAAAYAVDLPEAIVSAAEHGAVPRLDQALSLDMARRAVAGGRGDLISRIDRAGTPAWRNQDPWLALTLARQAGDFAGALRYAALLPSGRDEARRSLVMASGDRPAIRAMLLEQAGPGTNRGPIAQQLLQQGFRTDAVRLLQDDSANRSPADPAVARLLFLMGPRPDPAGLQWLRDMATRRPEWRTVYVERERPAAALAFLRDLPESGTTQGLLQQLRLANAAHDREAGLRLVARLLDGRSLSAADTALIAANAPPRLDNRWALALARARLATRAATSQDQLDLAWDAWNRGHPEDARGYLDSYLTTKPADLSALRLMAEVENKQHGKDAARVWLSRALAVSPPASLERAEILERLGRTNEAIPIVAALRASSPGNSHLTAVYGRLLIAAGDPGRARKVLQP